MTYVPAPSRSTHFVAVPRKYFGQFIAVGIMPSERISHLLLPMHCCTLGNTILFVQRGHTAYTQSVLTKIAFLWRNHYPGKCRGCCCRCELRRSFSLLASPYDDLPNCAYPALGFHARKQRKLIRSRTAETPSIGYHATVC